MLRSGLIALALWLAIAPTAALAGPSLVFDPQTGIVLHDEDATAPWFPASLTKLMTAYLTFSALRAGRLLPSTDLTVSARAAAEPPSKLGLPIGAKISVDLALRVLLVKSANDIAVVLAEGVWGDVDAFVSQMNATARGLGMTDTYFVNPNGLPAPEQVTTARDMGLLAQALLRDFPEYRHLFGLDAVKVGKRTMRTHNKLIGKFDGADGMKTGFICASGFNLVASATRNGRQLVAVVLGAPSGKTREEEAADLLQKGFESTWWTTLLPRKLAQMKPAKVRYARPQHMGPVVCKRRYPAGQDAYVIDARLRQVAETKAGEADGDDDGAALSLAAPSALPSAVAAVSGDKIIKGRPARGVPVPPMRPRQ